ncbi:MAG: hypothetical protein IH957_07295 [Chloroflexi bacterium]|nr:hypothetical protein [Chloroflexota bacterium]
MSQRFPVVFLLVLALAAGVLLSSGAAAVGTAEIGFDHDGAALDINDGLAVTPAGGSITVSVVTELPPDGLGAWMLDIFYDPAVFSIGPGDCTAYGGTGLALCNPAFAPNVIRVVGAAAAGNFGTFNLADMTFQAIGAPGECSSLNVGSGGGFLFTDPTSPTPVDLGVVLSNGRLCIQGTNGEVGIDHDLAPPDINPGPVNLAVGDVIKLGLITDTPSPNLGAWNIDVHYDPSVLLPLGCDPLPLGAGGALSVCNAFFSVVEVRSVGSAGAGITGVINLANFEFQAVGPAGSCSPLEIDIETFADNASTEYNPLITDGEVCVTAASADVTGDGTISGVDISAIVKARFATYDPMFDLNGDEVVDKEDMLIAIQQMKEFRQNGFGTEPPTPGD